MSTETVIQPHPIVAINIDGADITVNGTPITHDGTQPPQQVAIHAVARQIAQKLGRPVRAEASDQNGRMTLVVHPDGHASDITNLPEEIQTDHEPVQSTLRTRAPEPNGRQQQEDSDTPCNETSPASTATVRAAPIPAAAQGAGSSPASQEAPSVSSVPNTRAARRADTEGRSFLTHNEDVEIAQTGFRGVLSRLGIRSGPSAAEQAQRADMRAISRHWSGPRTIAIVNGKGGSGKTPTTVILSALFARAGGSGVLAWDNNETRGTLGWRTETGPHESHVLDLLPHANNLMQPTARAADLAAYVHHQTDDKFDVLRSNPLLLPHQQRLTAEDFDAVHQVASKYFRLIFIDSGNDETAPHWLQMIDHADQLVVATTTRPDHAEAGRLLLDALRDRDEHSYALADNAVVVVSQADREEASAAMIANRYDGLARQAVAIPYDRAMRAPWLRYNSLQAATQRACLRAAAAVSEGL